jgi:myotubularin-related protein 9
LVNNTLEGGILILRCKDLRVVTLKISAAQEYLNIAGSIEKLSNLCELDKLYPFFFRPMFNILENGWQMYQLESEFSKLLAGDEWRVSHVNKEFKVCGTYPHTIIVPKIITDDQIIESAKFRDLNRFPMLSFKNKNGAILLRSAQPMNVSNGVKRCRADEAILNQVLGKSKKGFIVDTWGKNKSNTETDQHYSQWRKITRSIGNISSVSSILDSFSKMIEACNDVNSSTEKWLSRLENSGWLSLVLNSLNAACVIAQCLEQEGK